MTWKEFRKRKKFEKKYNAEEVKIFTKQTYYLYYEILPKQAKNLVVKLAECKEQEKKELFNKLESSISLFDTTKIHYKKKGEVFVKKNDSYGKEEC